MNTVRCPGCGQAVESGPGRCPRCGTVVASPPAPQPRPDWFPAPASPAKETGATMDAPTQVNGHGADLSAPLLPEGPVTTYPFLSPPRQPGEMGWLGTYRVLAVLGKGGMGVVFRAEDTHLERQVALKVMVPGAASEAGARQRFLREARLMASLRSDHIVTVHQVGEVDGVPWLAMELLQGETLSDWLRRGHRPGPAQVLDLALQLARGLEAAHAAGLVHRDVKPANIWVEAPSGRVKILDFGLARPFQDATQLTQLGTVVGTPAYMAPEQAEGGAVDARSDLFSLGCVLYELAAGEPPFVGATTFAILTAMAVRDPQSLRTRVPAFPPELSALVMRLLAKKPADRPASASEVVAAISAIAEAHPELRPAWLSGSRPAHQAAATPVSRRAFWMAGLGAVGAAAVAGGLWYALRPSKRSRPTSQGVAEDRVLFGLSAPFSGPTAELGRGMQTGLLACFKELNEKGGIAGRRLELTALDDGYEPDRSLANVKRLNEEAGVFAFVGNVGTPNAAAYLPYLLERKRLLFGAFTGSHLLRKEPPDRYVLNYRASLAEETGGVVRHLIDVRKVAAEGIAVFSQDDEYGAAGYRGVELEMRRRGRASERIVHVRYKRNTVQVEPAVKEVVKHEGIRAIVTVGTYRPAARFVKLVRETRPGMIFTSTAFAGSAALAEELGQHGPAFMDGIIVTQTVPPVDSHASLVLEYVKRLRRHFPTETPNSVSLEGYIAATILAEALRRAGDGLDTESLIDAAESMRGHDIGLGVPIAFGPSSHQAVNKVWALVLDREGRYHPLDLD